MERTIHGANKLVLLSDCTFTIESVSEVVVRKGFRQDEETSLYCLSG